MTKTLPFIAAKYQFKSVLTVLSFLIFLAGLHAQNSTVIAFQGILKNASGAPVDDGTYQIKFRLYNASSGGTKLWEETAGVKTVGGIYSHNLGSVTSLNAGAFANTVYLGVEVNGYELTPRTMMTYAPYTFSAAYAQNVACAGKVGDVKYSILNPSQFQAENGDCWVPMDGRSLQPSDRLRVVTGMTAVPNVGGLFLRAQEFSNSPDNDPDRNFNSAVGSIQDDASERHSHTMTEEGEHTHTTSEAGEHTHSIDRRDNGADDVYDKNNAHASESSAVTTDRDKIGSFTTPAAGKHTHTLNSTGKHSHTISEAGDANETRPKNMNLWVYIRIN
ncbi:MAG: hypothetical protein RJA20_947 [Bacteroidota bacterium]|jgi:hypothetical protein